MGNNPSVRQFKTDMQEFSNKVGKGFLGEKLAQADELMGNMRNSIGHSVTGHLSQSIRKKDVSRPDRVSVLVFAGGPLTVKRSAAGTFDYSLAEEFGTVKEAPHPFFYGTYRQYKRFGEQQDKETLAEMIEENNRVRANRSNNYSNANVTVSRSHGGAVVLNKGKP